MENKWCVVSIPPWRPAVARKAASTCYTALTRNWIVTDEGNAVGKTRALFAAVGTCMSKSQSTLKMCIDRNDKEVVERFMNWNLVFVIEFHFYSLLVLMPFDLWALCFFTFSWVHCTCRWFADGSLDYIRFMDKFFGSLECILRNKLQEWVRKSLHWKGQQKGINFQHPWLDETWMKPALADRTAAIVLRSVSWWLWFFHAVTALEMMLWKCLPWVSSNRFWEVVPCRVVWSRWSLDDFLPEVPTGTGASWKARLWMAQNQARNMEHVTQLNSLKSTLLSHAFYCASGVWKRSNLWDMSFLHRNYSQQFFKKRVVLHSLLFVVPLIV